MSNAGTWRSKTRQQIETELMSELEEAERRLDEAPDEEKAPARELFTRALKRFNAFILTGKLPEEEK